MRGTRIETVRRRPLGRGVAGQMSPADVTQVRETLTRLLGSAAWHAPPNCGGVGQTTDRLGVPLAFQFGCAAFDWRPGHTWQVTPMKFSSGLIAAAVIGL